MDSPIASDGRCAACGSRSPTGAICAARYCMPETDYAWLPRESVLSFEEIAMLADVFADLGADRVRLTGGEPLLRRDLPSLIETLAAQTGHPGSCADDQRRAARAARGGAPARRPAAHHGSASTRCVPIASRRSPASTSTRRCSPASTRRSAEFGRLKIDTVVMRGVNDDELVALWSSAGRVTPKCASSSTWTSAARPAGRWTRSSRAGRCWRSWRRSTGQIGRSGRRSAAPAERFQLPDGLTFGIIPSTTEPFCADLRSQRASRRTACG